MPLGLDVASCREPSARARLGSAGRARSWTCWSARQRPSARRSPSRVCVLSLKMVWDRLAAEAGGNTLPKEHRGLASQGRLLPGFEAPGTRLSRDCWLVHFFYGREFDLKVTPSGT